MKKLFLRCIWLCVLTGLCLNLRIFVSALLTNQGMDSQALGRLSSGMMLAGNRIESIAVPGIAAGFIGLVMCGRLRLWQGSFLCLVLPFFNALFVQVVGGLSDLLFSSETFSISLSSLASYYVTESFSYSVPFCLILLVFYGFLVKDSLITALSLIWDVAWVVLLALIPPFFPQFSYSSMRMDSGELTRRTMVYGLTYLGIALLAFFIIYDLIKKGIRR